jgi:hypothetical protein
MQCKTSFRLLFDSTIQNYESFIRRNIVIRKKIGEIISVDRLKMSSDLFYGEICLTKFKF